MNFPAFWCGALRSQWWAAGSIAAVRSVYRAGRPVERRDHIHQGAAAKAGARVAARVVQGAGATPKAAENI